MKLSYCVWKPMHTNTYANATHMLTTTTQKHSPTAWLKNGTFAYENRNCNTSHYNWWHVISVNMFVREPASVAPHYGKYRAEATRVQISITTATEPQHKTKQHNSGGGGVFLQPANHKIIMIGWLEEAENHNAGWWAHRMRADFGSRK